MYIRYTIYSVTAIRYVVWVQPITMSFNIAKLDVQLASCINRYMTGSTFCAVSESLTVLASSGREALVDLGWTPIGFGCLR